MYLHQFNLDKLFYYYFCFRLALSCYLVLLLFSLFPIFKNVFLRDLCRSTVTFTCLGVVVMIRYVVVRGREFESTNALDILEFLFICDRLTGFRLWRRIRRHPFGVLILKGRISLKIACTCLILRVRASHFKSTCLLLYYYDSRVLYIGRSANANR